MIYNSRKEIISIYWMEELYGLSYLKVRDLEVLNLKLLEITSPFGCKEKAPIVFSVFGWVLVINQLF